MPDDLLAQAMRDSARSRMDAAAARRERDSLSLRCGRAEDARDAAHLRVSELLAGNSDLYSDLTAIITAAESGGQPLEIAQRARRARARLPKEGL
jgi:hypothetical protein